MTLNNFIIECEERAIEVTIALENDNVENALAERDDALVIKLLDSEF